MAINDQVSPSREETEATGVIGIIIYIVLLCSAIYSIRKGFRSKTSKRFFFVIALLCLLELPRYFGLAIQKKYSNTGVYSLHILANSVFFISFSIVCYQWSGLLKLGTYFKIFYGIKGLIAANLTFTIVDIVAVAVCVLSSSLERYFASFFFEIFTFIEAVRNVVYAAFLTFYGLKLVLRFWHFSTMATARWMPAAISTGNENQLFKQAVCRLTTVLTITLLCFTLRMCMLAAKMAALYSHREITSDTFTLFGFWWFVFADFVPRVVPCVAFMQLMGTKKLTSEQKRSLQTGDDYVQRFSANNGTEDEYQFVLLTGDEAAVAHSENKSSSSSGFAGATKIVEGWKHLDADSLFGGDDADDDDEDDDDNDEEEDVINSHTRKKSSNTGRSNSGGGGADGSGGGGGGSGRGTSVDNLYTIHLNLANSPKHKRALVTDTISL